MQLRSVLTCPSCGTASEATMPEDACQIRVACPACGAVMRPKAGDCCVFCSYGSIPCPPIQQERAQFEGSPPSDTTRPPA